MCKINAPKGDKTNTRSVDERTSYFESKNEQCDKKERRSTPGDVTKTNCYW